MNKNLIIKKYEKTFYNTQSEYYEARWSKHPRFRFHYRRISREIMKFLPKKSNSILDIGCGPGLGLLQFIGRADKLVGFDLSFTLLKVLKRKINQSKYLKSQPIFLIQGDAEHLPLKDNTFNLITFWGTIHHLPNGYIAIGEAKSKLMENGYITIHEPNKNQNKLILILSKLTNLIFLTTKRDKMLRLKNFYNIEEISQYEKPLIMKNCVKFFEKNGLQIISKKIVWYFGSILLNFPKFLQKILYIMFEKIDILIEKGNRHNGGAIFIISKNSDKSQNLGV